MGRIILLDENTANQIAAGEVVERPSSVVKELVENSIDAGADQITVEIKNGGIKYMKITDNGTGFEEDDIRIAFERHSTSKIRGSKDLESIKTLGFRGEALASIASVSKVTLFTKTSKSKTGKKAIIRAGEVEEISTYGSREGTTFIIEDLFFNTPARFKFLKKDTTESRYISDTILRLSLGNPNISMKLISNGKTVIHSPGNRSVLDVIYSVYGNDIAKDIIEVSHNGENISISGYIGREQIAKSSRTYQSIFINGRYIKNQTITSALDQAYNTYLMKKKFPFAVLKIDINPYLIDVNVHPAKVEIRFSDEKMIFREVYIAATNALEKRREFKKITLEEPRAGKHYESTTNDYKYSEIQDFKEPAREYVKQQTLEILENLKKENLENSLNKKIEENKEMEKENLDITNRNNNSEILEAKYIGQAFNTYIILQNDEELIFIDQHAAHERVLYEKIKNRHNKREYLSQGLIKPIVVELNSSELLKYNDYREILKELGFEIEYFGDNSLMLRGIPIEYTSISNNEFIDILDSLENNKSSDNENVYVVACKAAIKANKKLSEIEIKELLIELSKCENSYHCPHGRPTAFKLSKVELEKKFKRRI